MVSTKSKIENRIIRIEDGRIIGLGIGSSGSIDLKALDEFLNDFTVTDVVITLNELVQRLGGLGLHFYHHRESYPDLNGAITTGLPTSDDLYYINNLAKLFNS